MSNDNVALLRPVTDLVVATLPDPTDSAHAADKKEISKDVPVEISPVLRFGRWVTASSIAMAPKTMTVPMNALILWIESILA